MSKSPKVTCLLTGYKRPKNFQAQLEAVQVQSIPANIRVWWNRHKKVPPPPLLEKMPHVLSTPNGGVWPRFYYCLNFATEYVCVFDDDTIPGPRWLENCINTIQDHPGLLGTNGMSFVEGTYKPSRRTGWHKPNTETKRVDIVGHSWFFRRDSLQHYCAQPRATDYLTCGEDMHFSVALQLQAGLHTYVPPHPPDDKELWGSLQGGLGRDNNALWKMSGEVGKKQETFDKYRAMGWRMAHE
jgi:hypothetical protein